MTHRFLLASFVVAFGVPARAEPGGGREPPHDLHPARNFSGPPAPRITAPGAPVEQFGEVVIMEGDSDILSDDGSGGIGIVVSASAMQPGNLVPISNRFFANYPDEFDEIIVLTTFTDAGTPGALAYEYPVQQDVRGLGSRPPYPMTWDNSPAWGSATHKLHAFVDMKGVNDYPKYDGVPIDDARSFFYPVLGQEFAHRWLAWTQYRNARGQISDQLLGRDRAHWSPTLEAQGSVLDGNHWVHNPDGSFNCVERAVRYSQLDLYLMGLLPARAVQPFFIIDHATTDNGHVIDPVADWYYCEHVTGQREDVGIGQVIDAVGPRDPPFESASKSFRVAFVLITRPGERAGDVLPMAAKVERARQIWETKFDRYTGGTGSMCTQVSAPCGSPVARVLGGTLVEAGGDRNGIIEPGEPVDVAFTLENDGPVAATQVVVAADSPSLAFDRPSQTVASLPPGGRAIATFRGVFTGDPAQCNRVLRAHATASVGKHQFKGFAEALVGAADRYRRRFAVDGGGWGPNLAGKDTALEDTWDWGAPRPYSFYGFFGFQPGAGADGSPNAWFTGLERGNIHNGVVHGLGRGRATLWSPPVDLRGASRPRVRYAGWFEAIDLSVRDRREIASSDWLVLEGSNDAVKWFKLDQLDGADDRWRPRDLDLRDPVDGQRGLDVTRPVYFRFTANREGDQDLLEAGVSDFAVVADAPGCFAAPPPTMIPAAPASGCAISDRARTHDHACMVLAVAAALLLAGARSRRRGLRRGR